MLLSTTKQSLRMSSAMPLNGSMFEEIFTQHSLKLAATDVQQKVVS